MAMDIETGDRTYAERKARYDMMIERLTGPNKTTQTQLAKELGISKQAISRAIGRGTVRPSGRPRSNAGRIKRVVTRIDSWQARRTRKLAKGLDVALEDARIADLEKQLAALR